MNETMMVNVHDQREIQQKGFNALHNALGVVGTVYFLRQFYNGRGNYTEERKELLANVTEENFEHDLALLRSSGVNKA
jgi:hypothetical protein